jgi:hypothetical protein
MSFTIRCIQLVLLTNRGARFPPQGYLPVRGASPDDVTARVPTGREGGQRGTKHRTSIDDLQPVRMVCLLTRGAYWAKCMRYGIRLAPLNRRMFTVHHGLFLGHATQLIGGHAAKRPRSVPLDSSPEQGDSPLDDQATEMSFAPTVSRGDAMPAAAANRLRKVYLICPLV